MARHSPRGRRARRLAHAAKRGAGFAPISRPNLAPVAAVWLIAAVTMASTYPVTPHAILVDLPQHDPLLAPLTPYANLLVVESQGAIRWNGEPVDEKLLREILRHNRTLSPQPALRYEPDGELPYGEAVRVLDILRQEQAIDRCFLMSNVGRYRRYEQREPDDGPIPYEVRECMPDWEF